MSRTGSRHHDQWLKLTDKMPMPLLLAGQQIVHTQESSSVLPCRSLMTLKSEVAELCYEVAELSSGELCLTNLFWLIDWLIAVAAPHGGGVLPPVQNLPLPLRLPPHTHRWVASHCSAYRLWCTLPSRQSSRKINGRTPPQCWRLYSIHWVTTQQRRVVQLTV